MNNRLQNENYVFKSDHLTISVVKNGDLSNKLKIQKIECYI